MIREWSKKFCRTLAPGTRRQAGLERRICHPILKELRKAQRIERKLLTPLAH